MVSWCPAGFYMGLFFGGGLQSEFLDSRETGDRAVLSDSWNLSFHLTESLNS